MIARVDAVRADAVVFTVQPGADPVSLAIHLRTSLAAYDDVVPGAATVMVVGVTGAERDSAIASAHTWRPASADSAPRRVLQIPMSYDGPDLDAVADHLGLSVAAVITRHLETTWSSAFCGFAPGFAYLRGWDASVARRDRPRATVAPGSVALADGWCGIYPTPSPGGWQIIGHVDAGVVEQLWSPEATPPALLEPGTVVEFVAR